MHAGEPRPRSPAGPAMNAGPAAGPATGGATGGSVAGAIGAVWGVTGIIAVLVYAIERLGRFVVEALDAGLTGPEWVVLLANVAFVGYAEGVRGFQRRFSPRVAARALHLYHQPGLARVLLAPFFCSGFFAATPRLLRLTWAGAALIVAVVIAVGQLPQPWRGIVDAGVLAGLGWGSLSLAWMALATFRSGVPRLPAEVPAPAPDKLPTGADGRPGL